jgi:hypothetical protein
VPAGFGGRLPGKGPYLRIWDLAGQPILYESPRSTQPYIHADLKLKEKALARTASPTTKTGRYRPPDKLLAFLEGLGLCRSPDMRERGHQNPPGGRRHNRGPGIR